MRKPKISDQYDKESFIKGYKKGWGRCLGTVIGFMVFENPGWDSEEFKKQILSKHPYRSSGEKANE